MLISCAAPAPQPAPKWHVSKGLSRDNHFIPASGVATIESEDAVNVMGSERRGELRIACRGPEWQLAVDPHLEGEWITGGGRKVAFEYGQDGSRLQAFAVDPVGSILHVGGRDAVHALPARVRFSFKAVVVDQPVIFRFSTADLAPVLQQLESFGCKD